ncbi:unnamed protein product [Protopolystoma xenopodis]|uniref:Uncharacterized protein n=1 Tax=Protopolystoma xenopodis TaxID=117903 RepID=A0A3S5B8P9_9PLAT|nr:unnamed protein product [Protopolystoma xenopodis]
MGFSFHNPLHSGRPPSSSSSLAANASGSPGHPVDYMSVPGHADLRSLPQLPICPKLCRSTLDSVAPSSPILTSPILPQQLPPQPQSQSQSHQSVSWNFVGFPSPGTEDYLEPKPRSHLHALSCPVSSSPAVSNGSLDSSKSALVASSALHTPAKLAVMMTAHDDHCNGYNDNSCPPIMITGHINVMGHNEPVPVGSRLPVIAPVQMPNFPTPDRLALPCTSFA